MKLRKHVTYQCWAIVLPGEYTISRWDNQQCEETKPQLLTKCEECGHHFCLMLHWPKHNCTQPPF